MKRKVLVIMASIVAVIVVSAGSILAYEHYTSHERDRSVSVRADGVLPLVSVLDIAARHLPGEVLKIELENEHERLQYEIKVLADNGRVREIKLDARSGELIEIEDD